MKAAAQQSEFSVELLEGALEWLLAHYIKGSQRPLLLVCPAQPQADLAGQRLRALLGDGPDIRTIPDIEYLPYDHYSPAQQSVTARLKAIAGLAGGQPSLTLSAPANILHRLPPKSRLDAYTLRCEVGTRLPRRRWIELLASNAYYATETVDEPGSFSLRGDIIDIFVHGSERPWRIDTLDDEILSIRAFDPSGGGLGESQQSIDLAPGALVPLDDDSLARFKEGFGKLGDGAEEAALYATIQNHRVAQGIESYFPLFYESLTSLPELIGESMTTILMPGVRHTLEHYLEFTQRRYEAGRADPERPLLAPSRLLLGRQELRAWLRSEAVIDLNSVDKRRWLRREARRELASAPALRLEPKGGETGLFEFLERRELRCVVCSSSPGRMSYQRELLNQHTALPVASAESIGAALAFGDRVQITVAPFEYSFIDKAERLLVVGESVFGLITRSAKRSTVVDELTRKGVLLNNLDNLGIDEPLIHPDHGVGRFGGIVRLDVNNNDDEFVLLNYAEGGKLYLPIDQSFMLDRYHLGENEESAPWHKLKASQWRRAKRKARSGMDDLATRIIALHAARRQASGLVHHIDETAYQDFCAQFPYQETPDQRRAIEELLQEMRDGVIIDRLVVGEVGCGKTEVALRAVYVCVANKRQAVVMAPTTILTQQHYERFQERLGQWGYKVEIMSRFNQNEHDSIRTDLATGVIDVLVATQAALGDKVRYASLGLVVIDEEQRFGVAQKEQLRRFSTSTNVVRLSATPIPRTLQMALSGLSSLSLITTLPPMRRGVSTEVLQWDDERIRRCIEREIFRGGQVFVVHPRVRSLARLRERLQSLLPDARIAMVHGQSDVNEIERVMLDFHHHHSDILVTTTIIENGVDFPSANTIIINDATAFGLSTLHQLRGRVGRSHVNAFAYLVVPPESIHTPKARVRLEAIESHAGAGSGFNLAMADLELRGAGTALGGKQSGHEVKIGFSAYMGELARALAEHNSSLHEVFGLYEPQVVEVNTPAAALLPEGFIKSVSERLRHYRAIHYASDSTHLYELRAELYERYGQLPAAVENLFAIAALRQKCQETGASAVDCTGRFIRIKFSSQHRLDLDKLLAWAGRYPKRISVGDDSLLEIRHRRGRDDDGDEDPARSGAQITLCGHILDYLAQGGEPADGAVARPQPPADADPFSLDLASRYGL